MYVVQKKKEKKRPYYVYVWKLSQKTLLEREFKFQFRRKRFIDKNRTTRLPHDLRNSLLTWEYDTAVPIVLAGQVHRKARKTLIGH